ncbi:DNA cytosine methyltransferase [Paenibacillus sp. Soil750]|uniref:DNA cytosine methyltransferase n=1 Tax=Paenibacillus sp. Soil750 TaxID=1736398 RepID=UPI000A8317A4|nr:DNA cytosine methyltransferase [Paenibacillus sp. Soil750]
MTMSKEKKYTVLDLFCGAGGMSEGFMQAGFYIPFASDYSKEAAETYKNRHAQLGHELTFFQGDIRSLSRKPNLAEFLNGASIDVIVGGPPCQGFSLSGKRDENDPRNKMFLEYLKIVKSVQPKYFVMENVEGILSYRFTKIRGVSGKVYINELASKIIEEEALKLGYRVQCLQLNAKDYGVPQNRPRVIFIANKVEKKGKEYIDVVPRPSLPKKREKIVTVQEAISDLSFLKNGESSTNYNEEYEQTAYQSMLRNGLTPGANNRTIRCEELLNHKASKHLEKTVDRFNKLNPGETIAELLGRLDEIDHAYYFTKKYRCSKLDRDQVSPTVLTLPDDIIHYDETNPRILTVREFARLQSFDDSFEFCGKRTTGGERRKFETPQYTQVGNAVPPLFARAIAVEVMCALQQIETTREAVII